LNGVDNELLEQVSFSLDLLSLDLKLRCTTASVDDGARAPVDEKAK
jgi:hypothetical protein